MTRQEFLDKAGSPRMTLEGKGQSGPWSNHTTPKRHSSGAVGWSMSGKVQIKVADGSVMDCSYSLHVTVQNSAKWEGGVKEWSQAVADNYAKKFGNLPPNVVIRKE